MTTILQITDTHIVPEGTLVSGRLETSASLQRLIARITSIRDQLGTIDAVLVTGDLSDDGSAESYEIFKTLMAPLDLPMLVIPGNHDAREPMRAAFADQLPRSGPLNWLTKLGDLTIIGLDTLVEGSGKGTLLQETLSYLIDALADSNCAPVLIALHHPPFPSGIAFMDGIGLTNRDSFGEIVACHKGTLRIVCGHIHSMMVAEIAGHVAISAPSPCSTFALDLRPNAPVGYLTTEDGCLLHRWDAGFQTVRIGPVVGAGPFPF